MNNKIYKTSPHTVAYIDILGSKDLIKNNINSLQVIHEIYDIALNKLKDSNNMMEMKIEARIFSDNIVLFQNIESMDEMNIIFKISHLIYFSAILQEEFCKNGILLRGGISIGEFFADSLMIWGDALISAYKLESELAIYPRIVVDPQVIEKYYYIDYGLWSDEKLIKDFDGFIFVNYLHELTIDECWQFMKAAGKNISESDNYKVQQKRNWHDNYLRKLLKKLQESEEV